VCTYTLLRELLPLGLTRVEHRKSNLENFSERDSQRTNPFRFGNLPMAAPLAAPEPGIIM